MTGLLAGAIGSFTIALTSALFLPFCPRSSGAIGRALLGSEYQGWDIFDKTLWVLGITLWGLLGSVLDSFLGAILQASVVDSRTGKVVEGSGGQKVLVKQVSDYGVKIKNGDNTSLRRRGQDKTSKGKDAPHQESRRIVSGVDLLDNNQINFLMAAIMSIGGMVVASFIWEAPKLSISS